jgi:SpoVK/Ycf46/Vps4 family AAA+-type ATPase
MDGVSAKQSAQDRQVIVIGATNRPDQLDRAFRRPGRFDREIEIGIPSKEDRLEILRVHLRAIPHALSEEHLTELAASTHAFVGADLKSLVQEGVRFCLSAPQQQQIDQKQGQLVLLRRAHMHNALQVVKPSAMREVLVDVPSVYWTDIGGQEATKAKLREAVDWPLEHPEAFERLGISPPKGILLYGPPGCSKTMMAKALATESKRNFLAVKGPELFSKWVGESEKAVRNVFRKARAAAPSIIFFDEIDAIAVQRSSGDSEGSTRVGERVLAQLLIELDGAEALTDVTILAATNRPDLIDSAMLRPGRIDRMLYVGLPDTASRKRIFEIQLGKLAHSADLDDTKNLDQLAALTKGNSGAEIALICREAATLAMRADIDCTEVTLANFKEACIATEPRITQEALDFYKKYEEDSGAQIL